MRLRVIKVATVPLRQCQATLQPRDRRSVPRSLVQGTRLAPHGNCRCGLSDTLPCLAEPFEHGWQQLGATAFADERQGSTEVVCRLVVGIQPVCSLTSLQQHLKSALWIDLRTGGVIMAGAAGRVSTTRPVGGGGESGWVRP